MANSMKLDEIELVKLPISITQILDDYVLVKRGLELQTFRNEMLRGMVTQLKSYVLAEEVDNRTKSVAFKYKAPKNWLEHLKLQLPSWTRKFFTPKLVEHQQIKRVTFRRYATFPKANILFPDKVGTLIRFKQIIEEVSTNE
jgi:hypothetical protein